MSDELLLRLAVAADEAAIVACVRAAYARYLLRIGRAHAPMTDGYTAWRQRDSFWSALLCLVAFVALSSPAVAQLPRPPSNHQQLSPCFVSRLVGAGGAGPPAPTGLSAVVIANGMPNAGGVALSWESAGSSSCVAIEEQGPLFPQWTQVVVVPGSVTQTVVSAVSVSPPGNYCFRAFAASNAGQSEYSNQACVDISGAELTFAQGWNLIGGLGSAASTLTAAVGSVYTYDAAQNSYIAVPPATPLREGAGYWVYLASSLTVAAPSSADVPVTVSVTAGSWAMIGNPSATVSAEVSGADFVYIYDPLHGYQPTFTLAPGQGAWAYAASDSTITISPESP